MACSISSFPGDARLRGKGEIAGLFFFFVMETTERLMLLQIEPREIKSKFAQNDTYTSRKLAFSAKLSNNIDQRSKFLQGYLVQVVPKTKKILMMKIKIYVPRLSCVVGKKMEVVNETVILRYLAFDPKALQNQMRPYLIDGRKLMITN